jgi:hypothetical protein
MRKQQSVARMQAQCDAFNAKHKVGDTIHVWPGTFIVPPVPRQITEPGAHVLSGHTAVVQVAGGRGCIALSHVAPKERK